MKQSGMTMQEGVTCLTDAAAMIPPGNPEKYKGKPVFG